MKSPSRPLRIVYVAPFGLRQKTTVWARTVPLARELSARGHVASIVVPPWDSPADAGVISVRDGVRIEHVAMGGGIPGVVMRMMRVIAAAEPDIVHIVKPRAYAGIVQWLLWQKRLTGRTGPAIVLDVDDWEKPWAAIIRYPPYQAKFLAWQEDWGYRHADGISAASRWLVTRAGTMSPQTPCLYLPNGIDGNPVDGTGADGAHAEPHAYALRRPPRLLLLSRFVEVEPAWLGAMWHALRQQVPDAALFVAGRALHGGGELPYLRALMATSHEGSAINVVWLGYVNPSDLPALYDSVDCALFPSDDTEILRAKCSVRMATALQWGVPTVASAVGEQAAYGGDGAACLVPANAAPSEFAAVAAKMLRDENIRAQTGRNGAARVNKRYSWSTLADSLEEFYVNTLGEEV